ncbi:hypothetical protein DPEC_G00083690 [Dallia pectoralis]|uniref:Uncharacterized protein n=1 Tax=Dallia pectoralis TaxID=75939 RepID=A0ACC2GZQ4_DALPE|nr:hypothetical protein DPEC_G00083690 [Dallia pectoralis]
MFIYVWLALIFATAAAGRVAAVEGEARACLEGNALSVVPCLALRVRRRQLSRDWSQRGNGTTWSSDTTVISKTKDSDRDPGFKETLAQ